MFKWWSFNSSNNVRQPVPSKIVGLSDANWVACPVTRKSSGCTHLMLGRYPIFAGTTTQAVISLSSGEREFYAAVRGACRALKLAPLMLDLGFSMQAVLRTDSAAAKGLTSRRGARQARHIHCPALWLQQGIARQKNRIQDHAGSTLSANAGTKARIPAQKMWELLTEHAEGSSQVHDELTS